MKLFLLTLAVLSQVSVQTEQTEQVDLSDLNNENVETIMEKPLTYTKQIVNKPIVKTETVIGKTRYIRDVVTEPIRKRIVHTPYVNNTLEKINPVFNKQQDRVVNRDDITMPTKYSEETKTRTINVPGDIINNQTYIQPSQVYYKEQVQFVPSEDIRQTLPAQYKPVETKNNNRVRTANIEGDVHIKREFIQPHYETEQVKVNWVDSPAVREEREPITEPTKYVNNSRVQNVTAQGDLYVKQPVYAPSQTNHHVRVRFNQAPTQTKTLETINNKPIYTQSGYNTYHRRNYPVAVPKAVGVPVPVVYEKPYVKYEYYQEKKKCDPCCCNKKPQKIIMQDFTSFKVIKGKGSNKVVKEQKNDAYKKYLAEEKLKREQRKKFQSWNDVVREFNHINKEKEGLVVDKSLDDSLYKEAERNTKKFGLGKFGKSSYRFGGESDSDSESSEDSDDESFDSYSDEGHVTAFRNETVQHHNKPMDYSYVFDQKHNHKEGNPFGYGYEKKSDIYMKEKHGKHSYHGY